MTFRERLEQESPWWVPESIDDRMFDKIFNGVQRFLADVGADRNHEVRRSIDDPRRRPRRPSCAAIRC